MVARTDESGHVIYGEDNRPIFDEVAVLDEVGNTIIDEYVKYIDPGAGPESALDQVTILKEEFLKTWIDPRNPQAGFGYVLSPRGPPTETPQASFRVLDTNEEMSIRGAFFPFLVVIFIAIVAAVKAAVAAAIAAVTGLIAGLVSGIGTIISSFGSFFTGLFTGNFLASVQGLFGGILTGLGQIGGAFVSAFTTIHAGLLSAIQGIAGSVSLFGFSLSSFTATSAFSGALKLGLIGLTFQGTGKLLSAIGLSPKITQTLMSGGKLVLGIGLLATGNPLGLGFIGSGVGELLNLYTSLPPLLTNVISIGATALGAFAGGVFAPNLTGLQMLQIAAPHLAMDLASAGLVGVGNALGLDPRITALIGSPIMASVGGLINGLGSGKGIFDSIKGALQAGAKSIGFDFGGATTHPIFGSLGSGTVLKSVESTLGKEGLFSSILGLLGKALLSPFNAVDGLVRSILSGAQNFLDLIQQKGLAGTFESLATSIFSRKTIESLLGQGGVGGVISTVAKVLTTLDGQTVQEQSLGGGTSLFYDLAGNFIGKKENGVTQIGTFGVDQFGKWALLAGKVIGTIFGFEGLVFAADVLNGQLGSFTISNSGGVIIEGNPEGTGPMIICGPEGNCPVDIPGPGPEPPTGGSGGSFWNAVFKFLPLALNLFLNKGSVNKVEIQAPSSTSSGATGGGAELLYALVNGVRNKETHLAVAPDYIRNLSHDLYEASGHEVDENSDIITAPVYQSSTVVRNDAFNLIKDMIHWVKEVRSPFIHGVETLKVIANFNAHFFKAPEDRTRPITGVGYSGGFAPLIEAVVSQGYNAKTLVGLGAATTLVANLSTENTEKLIDLLERGLFGLAADLLKNEPSGIPSLIGTSVQRVINVWGTEDILARGGIAGYRATIGGVPAINIEIQGATHFDYMRRDDETDPVKKAFNVKVSNFVTELILQSDSQEKIEAYLRSKGAIEVGGIWRYVP